MQQNHRANVWITPETREQLIAIGRAHGAAKGREVSPGIRVAAGYHTRLVEALRDAVACNVGTDEMWLPDARALLKEIEEAR